MKRSGRPSGLPWGLLGPLAVLLTAGAVLVQLLRPLPAWTPPSVALQPAQRALHAAPQAPALTDLTVIWQRDLRQPLVDPVPAPVPEPKLAIRLVGTVIEPEHRYGLFQLSDNATVVRALGARIEDFEVVAIERGRARLSRAGREYDLTVPWYDRLRPVEGAHGH